MYLVKSKILAEIKEEILSTDEETIMFEGSRIVSTALVWMKDMGKYPIVRYKPIDKDLVSTEINSYINTMNVCYKGKMDLWVYVNSTVAKERVKAMGTKLVTSLGNLADIFDRCPKAKNKITLLFDSSSKTDVNKVKELFSPDKFNIRVMETKNKPVDELEAKFEKAGYSPLM